MSSLVEELEQAPVLRVRRSGRTVTITFGINDVRDLSGGALPVEVVRWSRRSDGTVTRERGSVEARKSGVRAAVKRLSLGTTSGAVEQWIEIRAFSFEEVAGE